MNLEVLCILSNWKKKKVFHQPSYSNIRLRNCVSIWTKSVFQLIASCVVLWAYYPLLIDSTTSFPSNHSVFFYSKFFIHSLILFWFHWLELKFVRTKRRYIEKFYCYFRSFVNHILWRDFKKIFYNCSCIFLRDIQANLSGL